MAAIPPLPEAVAYVCAIWSVAVIVVQFVGISNIFGRYSSRPPPPVSPSLPKHDVPHITVIRPVKGLEPNLYDCIASTFQLDYPRDKLTIYLCVSERSDPAYPVLTRLVRDFPQFDARVFLEEEDPLLCGAGRAHNLGPNPKIRNMSRAYREAKGDLIWIIDCNVWVGKGVAGRMVDKLTGLRPDGKQTKPYKLVHLLPLATDTESAADPPAERLNLLSYALARGGGRLDEMFMATTHAKFYGAINAVGVAPCVVGKSNMFRKSHLDSLTDPDRNPASPPHKKDLVGIDYFSDFICEDHLISELLWKANMPGYENHGLVFGDLAIQPMTGFPVSAYVGRRVRWLRARKWTVPAATLVEPGIESLLCCAYFSYALTTIPWFHDTLGVPQTWGSMSAVWISAVTLWMVSDWYTYDKLHAGQTVEVDDNTPKFARGTRNHGGAARRSFLEWLPAWIGREVLAFPVWTWAVLLGSTVKWRGRTFHVRRDMSAVEVDPGEHAHAQ